MGLMQISMYVPNQVNYGNQMNSNWVHTSFKVTISVNMRMRCILSLFKFVIKIYFKVTT